MIIGILTVGILIPTQEKKELELERRNATITRRKATKTRMYPAMETRMGGMEETREPKAGKASI